MLQDPTQTHYWWAKATGLTSLDITLVAQTVSAGEAGNVSMSVFGPAGLPVGFRSVAYPAAAGTRALAPPVSIAAGADSIYRIEVRLQPPPPPLPIARHYTLQLHGASAFGTNSPLQAQAEKEEARWFVNVGVNEPLVLILFGGPEAPATTGTYELRDPSGALVASNPIGALTFLPAPAPGMWSITVRGADGHYLINKVSGIDRGIYANWLSSGFASISGDLLRGGLANTIPVELVLLDLSGNVVDSRPAVTSHYEFGVDKTGPPITPGFYTLQVIDPDTDLVIEERTVVVWCALELVVDFDLPRPPNLPPIADAGPGQTVPEGSLVALDGSGSFDPEGSSLSYHWELVFRSAPEVFLSDPDLISPTFMAIDDATYIFRLNVTDDGRAIGSDDVRIDVFNVAPAADAGPDQEQYWGLPVSLDGAADDPGALDIAAVLGDSWDFDDGSSSPGLDVTHSYAVPGLYEAALTVTDKDGGVGDDSAIVSISARPTSIEYTGATSAADGESVVLSAQLSDLIDPSTALLGGRAVQFEVGGSLYIVGTDASGVATLLPIAFGSGAHSIVVTFPGDSLYLASANSATLQVSPPPLAIGHVTGGVLQSGTFGRGSFNVRSDGVSVGGELQFHYGRTNFHARDLTFLEVSPDLRTARFGGFGTDGSPFEAYAEDNGGPGRDDVFRLSIDGDPVNGDGDLTGGNVQIHR